MLLVHAHTCIADQAITASAFLATYNPLNTYEITEDTVVSLDVDLEAPYFVDSIHVQAPFNPVTNTITFTSDTYNALRVSTGALWTIAYQYRLAGTARLHLEPQATLYFTNGSVSASDGTVIE